MNSYLTIPSNKITVPRMRTVHEAAEELRKLDAGTAVTEYHIRQLAVNNIIPRVKAGKKYLINLDALIAYLADPADEGRN